MEDIFIKILNMSITASYFVIALVIIRAVFRKIPKWLSCVMWGLVGLRLILPFSFESILSLIPSAETIPSDITLSKNPQISSGVPIFNNVINPVISESFTPDPSYSVNPLQVITFALSVLWLTGIAVMLIYTLISYVLLRIKTRESIRTEDGTYICDTIGTPFILGIIKPKIYIPSVVTEADRIHIIAHEKAHIKRMDHLWKPLGFLLLSVYWFNPLIWAAYVFLCRDIEAACDEKVLKNGGAEIKKSYSEALINCSAPKQLVTACPLAFGETGVKQRIKNVLSYKKPTLWIIIIALIISIVLSVCFMTNPKGTGISDIEDYGNIYKNVSKVQLYIGTSYIYTNEDPSELIKEIKKVRLEETAAHESRNENRDKSYRIEFDDTLSINIDESFTYLWLDDTAKPSFTYKIKNPEILKNLFSISNYASGVEDVYVTVDKVTVAKDSMNFEVTWHNERDERVTFGEMFSVEKYNENGQWERYSFPEDFAFTTIAYLLPGNSEKTEDYYCPARLSDGNYRFSSSFTFEGKEYFARATFIIGEDISPIGGVNAPTNILTGKQLTLNDVIRLSKKGKDLSWEDFEDFSYIETGSGLYIRTYKIDGRFSLTIGGSGTESEPMYIYLCAPDGAAGNFIDIRGNDVEAFIEENKDNPFPEPDITFGIRTFPVDKTGDNLGTIIKYGAYASEKLSYSSIRYFPVVRIENEKGLETFRDFFKGTFDFDMKFEDTGFSFSEVYGLYKNEYTGFFGENDLLIVYISSGNEKDRFEAMRVYPDNDTLRLNIRERHYKDAENDSPTGWLMVFEVPKGPLQEITKIEAYSEETVYLPEPEIISSFAYKNKDEAILCPKFHLYDDGTFMLSPSPYSSHIDTGTYRYEGALLILTTYDDIYVYAFEMNSDQMVYKADNSIVHPSFYEIPHEAVFTEY